MKIISLLTVLFILGLPYITLAQKENKLIRSGNSKFSEKEYNPAEINYRKALEINPASQNAMFNLGTALYKQDNMQEAAKSFETLAANSSIAPAERSEAFYNLGNTLLETKQYNESIECYKNALRLNPNNEDARYNLAYAKQFVNENQQQQQQQQNKDDKQQQQEQEQQDKQEQEQKNKQEQQQQQQQQQPRELTRKEAEKMLEALKNNEKDSREKVKLEEVKAVRLKSTDKDW